MWDILFIPIATLAYIFIFFVSLKLAAFFYFTFLMLTLSAFRLFLLTANLSLAIAALGELLINELLADRIAFQAEQLYTSYLGMFNIAVFVLGITYVLSVFWIKQLNLVDWKRALAWLLGGLLFYNLAGTLLINFEEYRRGIGYQVYATLLGITTYDIESTAQNSAASDVFNTLADPDDISCMEIETTLDDTLDVFSLFQSNNPAERYESWGCLTNRWSFLTYDTGIDSIDVAYAVISSGVSVENQAYEAVIPVVFFDTHFGASAISDILSDSIDNLLSIWNSDDGDFTVLFELLEGMLTPLWPMMVGTSKMYMAFYIAVISVFEQTTYFIYSIAFAGVFFAMLLMLPLAFFKPLEQYALGLLKEIWELFWSFFFSQLMLAMGVVFILLGAGTQLHFVISIFALCAALPVLIGFMTAVNAFQNAVKKMTAIGGQAAQSAVSQSTQLWMGAANARAKSMAKKAGITGADGALGGAKPTTGLGKMAGALTGMIAGDLKRMSDGNKLSSYNLGGAMRYATPGINNYEVQKDADGKAILGADGKKKPKLDDRGKKIYHSPKIGPSMSDMPRQGGIWRRRQTAAIKKRMETFRKNMGKKDSKDALGGAASNMKSTEKGKDFKPNNVPGKRGGGSVAGGSGDKNGISASTGAQQLMMIGMVMESIAETMKKLEESKEKQKQGGLGGDPSS